MKNTNIGICDLMVNHQGRLALSGLLCLLLTACSGLTPDSGAGAKADGADATTRQAGFLSAFRSAAPKPARKALRSADLARGAIVVQGPDGYCIEPTSLSRKQGGFALLASCHALTDGKGMQDVTPALFTVSVGPLLSGRNAPSAAELAAALATMQVIAARDLDGLAVVQLGRGGDSMIDEGDPVHWRGAMVVNNRLIGLAAYGVNGGAIATTVGGELLTALARSIRTASPVAKTPAKKLTKTNKIAETTPPSGRKGLRGALQSLFN